ncbi:hypothetical protein HJG54_24075 [Leptolyngbya sp. NK1-12]|uniref:Uncharacterized protein n=1 Tax=Leptolyngbya sp. NK1-12 TaxID=2547451 RepID=A0AA96WJ33_9CYAN|nr:hypothetical protein [Leptolyngbya sp. NK1-12]WNZ25610.1 hypothetical protein HJG54_24075 [Leptolyngbya sp. NK1-12]
MLQNRMSMKNIVVAGTIAGSTLASLAALIALPKAVASPLNPCPGIYYEEPFNSTRISPQGCPPNAATQGLTPSEAQTPAALPNRTIPLEAGPTPLQPPLPENRAEPVATVALSNNSFDVRLTNRTNALVTFEVVGQTQRRYLEGGQEVILQGISAPATITFVRQDDGFVEVVPISTSEPGLLAVQLDEDASPLDANQGVLRIQQDGQVFLN